MSEDKKTHFSKEEVESIRKKLESLPAKQAAKTKKEVVAELFVEISELRKKGYTLDDIRDSLVDSNLSISTPTLRKYLSEKDSIKEKNKKPISRKKTAQVKEKINTEERKSSTFSTKDEDSI